MSLERVSKAANTVKGKERRTAGETLEVFLKSGSPKKRNYDSNTKLQV